MAPPLATAGEVARESFAALHALSKQWYDKEREGIALIESFQTALLACRNEGERPKQTTVSDTSGGPMAVFLARKDDDTARRMDPLLAEDLYAQIGELRVVFEQLLDEMYLHLAKAKEQVDADDEAPYISPSALSVVDYVQFLGHEVASFEAEHQHIEALLAMISFSITVDQLRTLVISWSTSPFLNPDASREFRQRHERSQQLRSA